MDHSTPGFPVRHQLPEFTQIHVHRVGDAIQPSHPLWSPSPSALNLSQHQGLFKLVSSLHHFFFKLHHCVFYFKGENIHMHLCVKEMNNNIISGFEHLCQLICNDLVKIVPCYVFRCIPPQKNIC